MYKEIDVVMLPTNKKAGLGSIYKRIKKSEIGNIDEFDKIGRLFINKNPNVQKSNSDFEAQHLYFLSDEKIKEGDWCIMLDSFGNVFSNPQQYIDSKTQFINKGHRKIICSTDTSLELPQPSESFIKHYVEEYNKVNIITKVMVEYDCDHSKMPVKIIDVLKINPDNTINIKPIKESWNREEVHNLMMQAWICGQSKPDCHYTVRENWIKENL